eukprot:TRINITY_DN23659_c2_g1_i1.p1 TRINITY_DN23659_c2_g1~~TRINITY_DN23659_c2_g1_i1.p1  ORF type:complete len:1615 (+),score=541.54 TRINITY_DN23659_c2_g1_i1:86-4846(+)
MAAAQHPAARGGDSRARVMTQPPQSPLDTPGWREGTSPWGRQETAAWQREQTNLSALPPSTAAVRMGDSLSPATREHASSLMQPPKQVMLDTPKVESSTATRGRRGPPKRPTQGRHRGTVIGGFGKIASSLGHVLSSPWGGSKGKRKRTHHENADLAEQGVAQMTSLVVTHLLAPLWSVGMRRESLPRGSIDWSSKEVSDFVRALDETRDAANWQNVCSTLERNPALGATYLTLNVSRLEHIERRGEDAKYSGLRDLQVQHEKQVSKVMKNWTKTERWNDELHADYRHRSVTAMGGKPLVDLGANVKVNDLHQAPRETAAQCRESRSQVLENLLLASSMCRFNFRDEHLYFTCNELKEQMFLIAPSEELSSLCCGEKGPVYLSKYLRFLMANSQSVVTDAHDDGIRREAAPFAGSVPSSPGYLVPQMVQDAALPLLYSLFNLAHNGGRCGEYLVQACAIAVIDCRHEIDELECRIAQIDSWQDNAERQRKQRDAEDGGRQVPLVAGMPVPAKVLAAVPMKLLEVAGTLGRKAGQALAVIDRREEDNVKIPDARPQRNKVAMLKDKLPSLLIVIKLLLQRVHCYGSGDAARAWAELIGAVRPLMQYPVPTGRLASDVLRAATASVQCMDSLLRYRLSTAFVSGHCMETLKRDRVRLLFCPDDPLCTGALSRIFLGRVECARPEGPNGPLLHLPIRSTDRLDSTQLMGISSAGTAHAAGRTISTEGMGTRVLSVITESTATASSGQAAEQLCDDIAAPASLAMNVFARMAEAEKDAADAQKQGRQYKGTALERPVEFSGLESLPAARLARCFPHLYNLMRGPIGTLGRLMTFSEGSGGDLRAVPAMYNCLAELYEQVAADRTELPQGLGQRALQALPRDYRPSPPCPMLDIQVRAVHADAADPTRIGAAWCEKLLEAARDHWEDRKGRGALPVERLHPLANQPLPDGSDYDAVLSAARDDIRLAVAGGTTTMMGFCNGLAELASRAARNEVSDYSFKVYPLPIGSESLLSTFLERHDPTYFQFVSWPLWWQPGECAQPNPGDVDRWLADMQSRREADTNEGAMMRNAIDLYCGNADKCHRVYVYKLEAWHAPRPRGHTLPRSVSAGTALAPPGSPFPPRSASGAPSVGTSGGLQPLASPVSEVSTPASFDAGHGVGNKKPDMVLAWCQQVELGPSSLAGDSHAGRAGAEGMGLRSPRPLSNSPSMGSFSYPYEDHWELAGHSPSSRNLRGTSPTASPASPMRLPRNGSAAPRRRGTSTHRGRTGSLGPGRRPEAISIGTGPLATKVGLDDMSQRMRGTPSLKGIQAQDLPADIRGASPSGQGVTGKAVIDWVLKNFQRELTNEGERGESARDVATRIAQECVDAGVLRGLGDGTAGGDTTFQDSERAWYCILIPSAQQDDARLEGAYSPVQQRRKNTVTSPNPTKLCVSYTPMQGPQGGRRYPELPKEGDVLGGRELMVQKISVRNVGKEGDRGLRPDPTSPALETYLLANAAARTRKALAGEGYHYSMHGALTVEVPPGAASGQGGCDGFDVYVDGIVHGPFRKVRLSPYITGRRTAREGTAGGSPPSAEYTHLHFHMMSFCPIMRN